MGSRFFIQIVIVAAMAILLPSLYYYNVCKGLRKTDDGIPGKLNYILYDTTYYDAVFIGSSRVLRNVDPVLFGLHTGTKCYNAGIDGANLSLMDMLTRRFVLVHRKPGYVFINIDVYTLEKDSSFFYYPQFFAHVNALDFSLMRQVEPKFLLARYCPFIAISYIDDYLKGVAFDALYRPGIISDSVFKRKGFKPVTNTEYTGTLTNTALNFTYTTQGLTRLDSLCNYCKQQGCHIVFIMAPIYGTNTGAGSNVGNFYALLKSIEAKYDVKELNYFTDARFARQMFFNNTHLNESGACFYTNILADTFNSITGRAFNQTAFPAHRASEGH